MGFFIIFVILFLDCICLFWVVDKWIVVMLIVFVNEFVLLFFFIVDGVLFILFE